MRSPGLLVLAALLMAAPTTGCDSDDGGQVATDTTTTDTAEVTPPVGIPVTLLDFLTETPLEGVDVRYGGVTSTTDADGTVTLDLPVDGWFTLRITGSGLRDHRVQWYRPSARDSFTFTVATDTAVSAIEAVLGATVDDTKALGSIGLRTIVDGLATNVPNTQVTVTPTPEIMLMMDASSGTGLSPGDTTLVGSNSTAILVNVDAGSVATTFTNTDGYECKGLPLEMAAGTYTIAEFLCEIPPPGTPFQMLDFLTGSPLPDATLTYGSESVTTDWDGTAYVDIAADTWFEIKVTGASFRDHYLHGLLRTNGTYAYTIATDATIAAFEALLSLTVDNDKGILSVGARRYVDDRAFYVPGVTIGLDVASDLALAFDNNETTGLSPGSTTLQGSPSTVIFVNVTAGDVVPSFTHDDNVTCEGVSPVEVPAGAFVISTYSCTTPDE